MLSRRVVVVPGVGARGWMRASRARVALARVPKASMSTSATTIAAASAGPGVSHVESFVKRHVGPTPSDIEEMLEVCGAKSMDEFINEVVPHNIKLKNPLQLGDGMTEVELLVYLKNMVSKNKMLRSHIGMGYYNTHLPHVILRNVLESPAWYTPYTPYQPEISQGRLESLLNFQTGVSELTGMEVSNASLLDEATAAAEAMSMSFAIGRQKKFMFWVSKTTNPQTIAVMRTRAKGFGITLELLTAEEMVARVASGDAQGLAGALVQYPDTTGVVSDMSDVAAAIKKAGGLTCVATDLLSLQLLKPPGEWGADIVLGSAQRMGVPMGFGGPHAAFFATHNKYRRNMPGRIIGVSRDSTGNPALRLTLQTREQHIRRDKATSNVCTAQALLANIAAFYMLFHGPDGLKHIADRTHAIATSFAAAAGALPGITMDTQGFFDTVCIQTTDAAAADAICAEAVSRGFNLRRLETADNKITVSFDETSKFEHAQEVVDAVAAATGSQTVTVTDAAVAIPKDLQRTSATLSHPVFRKYTSEHDMLRYIYHLQEKDLGLQHAMMPLGSCTMKLNATTEMIPVTWPEIGNIHPYAPLDQAQGYLDLFDELGQMLESITGFAKVSMQPNSGAQGEYAGLMAIASYHKANGGNRDICLIPMSAHGTNPASAVMAGMKVVPIQCDDDGNIDVADMEAKCKLHKDKLAATMITYPSTHGVFEETIVHLCQTVHDHGGLVYMDGANLNAQVGLCSPAEVGADVCHLNLHKTFCIPHGGGGPGMGPIGVVECLVPHLSANPRDTFMSNEGNCVSAAPWGSSSILPISWAYIKMMGSEGLTHATKIAILNANYIMHKLKDDYKVLFTGSSGRCAHEFILDLRPFKASVGVSETDVAKRLIDYSFHAPTMSWPVSGTLMVEPTESESKFELDRFITAMKQIRQEIREVEEGKSPQGGNVLKQAPHTQQMATSDVWDRGYPRAQAVYPVKSLRYSKFWPTVGRLDDVYGDRNPVCSCPSMDEY